MSLINFTDCPIDTASEYDGSDQKRSIFYNGDRYMLKMPDRIAEEKQNEWNSSYSNSIYSEKICCDILAALGFAVQETKLGYIEQNGKRKVVVACKNFIPANAEMISFKAIANNILPDKLGRIPKLSEIYTVLGKPSAYFDESGCKLALETYWDTFILDAFLGNFDRHGNNWSYFNISGMPYVRPTPIYDCGSCLYPQVADEAIPKLLGDKEQIAMRIDKFPTAALMLGNGMKANYRAYINSHVNTDCTAALLRVFPRIDMKIVETVINQNPDISAIRKHFYITMLQIRYECILKSAYNSTPAAMLDSVGHSRVF